MAYKYKDLVDALPRKVFTYQDVRNIFPEDSSTTIQQTINRWIKNGSLVQLKKGMYKLHSSIVDYENTSAILYSDAYLSLETVLHRYGLLQYDQGPITTVHPYRSFYYEVSEGINSYHYKYSRVKPSLFFGFEEVKCSKTLQNYKIAHVEKALLDYIYLRKPGHVEDIDVGDGKINYERFEDYQKRFPKWVQEYIVF